MSRGLEVLVFQEPELHRFPSERLKKGERLPVREIPIVGNTTTPVT